jgi:hypothetical protein
MCDQKNNLALVSRSSRNSGAAEDQTRNEEQPDLVGLLLDAVEDNDQQLERVLGHLQEKPTDLERYVYLIRLCDRNETLFYKVLMSDRIRFLLASDCRRRLLKIWLHLPSFGWHAHFDPSQGTSRGDAA